MAVRRGSAGEDESTKTANGVNDSGPAAEKKVTRAMRHLGVGAASIAVGNRFKWLRAMGPYPR